MIRLVVFDLAGTTVFDPNAVSRCLVEAIEAAGGHTTLAEATALMGIAKPIAIRQLMPEADVEAVHADFRRRMLEFYRTSDEVRELDGASEVFRHLREHGILVATDTGFDREITDAIFDRLGWHEALDASICSDEVEHGRPDPDMVLALMERLAVLSPREVAKVGDTPADLGIGESAGCALNIGVLHGTHTREQLEVHPHTHLLPTIRQVPALLGYPLADD